MKTLAAAKRRGWGVSRITATFGPKVFNVGFDVESLIREIAEARGGLHYAEMTFLEILHCLSEQIPEFNLHLVSK